MFKPYDLVKERTPGVCAVRFCTRRSRPQGDVLCHMHFMRRWRALNPDKAAYATLRAHAKYRRIPFSLKLEEFQKLAEETGYLDEKGTFKHNLHFDRIDPARGYCADNLQVVSCSENAAKGNRERWLPENVREMLRRNRESGGDYIDPEDCPF